MALTEKGHAGGFILSEANRYRSRENITVNTPQSLLAGAVIGRILAAAAAVAGTNTGTGAVTVGAAIGPRTQVGIYKLLCVAAASNAGTFNLYAPDGTLVRQITVAGGAHVSEHLTITIADATDFIVGDSFTVEVTGGDYEELDPAATTGEQSAAGILLAAVDASAADAKGVALVRSCEVNGNELVWPSGISAGNKAIAVSRLAESGIIIR